jgi:hypothetical protein
MNFPLPQTLDWAGIEDLDTNMPRAVTPQTIRKQSANNLILDRCSVTVARSPFIIYIQPAFFYLPLLTCPF